MSSPYDRLKELRDRQSQLIARINEERMRSGQWSPNVGYLVSELEQVEREIAEVQQQGESKLERAKRLYPNLFGREFVLVKNGVRIVISSFDRERIISLILNDGTQQQIDALIDEIARNAGFFGDLPDGDTENPRLFGDVMMFPFNNVEDFKNNGINFSSMDPYAVSLGSETYTLKDVVFRFRVAMSDTAADFMKQSVLDPVTNLGPAIKSWWTSKPDPYWVATLGYYLRRAKIRAWIRKNKKYITNIDQARALFAANWKAVCLVRNDLHTINEDWVRILAYETGYTFNMMQQRSNTFVFNDVEYQAEGVWVETAIQKQEAWINQLNEDEQRLFRGLIGSFFDNLFDVSPYIFAGLALVAIILLRK
jgi:hypothetical protein